MLKRMKQAGYGIGAVLMATSAFAEGFTPPATVDLSQVLTYGSTIVAALVGMIVLRKAIKLTNRS